MTYRDAGESIRTYRNRLATDLAEARRAADEARQRASRVQVLEKELADTDRLLERMGEGRRLPMLDHLRIAAPCKESWDEMVGDDRARYCGRCEKHVYNLSAMRREEAEALLVAKEGKVCVRLYQRHDGTVLTADCPVGVRSRRRRAVAASVAGGLALAAVAAIGAEHSAKMGACAMPRPPAGAQRIVMGEVATVEPPDPTPPATVDAEHWMMGAPPAHQPPPNPSARPMVGRLRAP